MNQQLILHVDDLPPSYDDAMKNLTTNDNLQRQFQTRTVWPADANDTVCVPATADEEAINPNHNHTIKENDFKQLTVVMFFLFMLAVWMVKLGSNTNADSNANY